MRPPWTSWDPQVARPAREDAPSGLAATREEERARREAMAGSSMVGGAGGWRAGEEMREAGLGPMG